MGGLLLFRFLIMMALLCECVDGGWSFWTDWKRCPIPCEGKSKSRRRHCLTQFCNGYYYETKPCEPQDCLVTTKLITASHQQQSLETLSLTIGTGKQQNLNTKISGPVLLTPSMRPPYHGVKTPNRTTHISLTLSNSSKHHGSNTVNTEENLEHLRKWLTTTSTLVTTTRQISSFRDVIQEKVMKATPTMKTSEKDGDTSVVTVAISVTAVCVVLYTTAKLYKMFCREENRQPSVGGGVNDTTSARALSLGHSKIERPVPERVYEDYNYVSYDEIDKGINKSPTHSYVYDVTWF